MAEWKIKERHDDGRFQWAGTYRDEMEAREALHELAKSCGDKTFVQSYDLVLVRGKTEQSHPGVRVRHGCDGDLESTGTLVLHGVTTGNIHVVDGMLSICGECRGSMLVEANGKAFVYGTIDGNAENRGGTLVVCGTVRGQLLNLAGESTVGKTATVEGGVVSREQETRS